MRKLALIFVLLISVVVLPEVRADKTFSGFSVFGDSLSADYIGFGRSWAYFLREPILADSGAYENFAVGGATSYSILQTISSYTASSPGLNPEALYSIFGGTNDASGYAGNIVAGVNTLYEAGAEYILVSNLHDCPRRSPVLIRRFNTDLRTRLEGTAANVIMVDTHALIDELNADPSSYGFVSDPVLIDNLHFSERTSSIISQYFQSVIQAPVLISVLPEFPGYAALLNKEKLDSILSNGRLDSPVATQDYGDDPQLTIFAEAAATFIDIDSKDEFNSSKMTDLSVLLAGAYPLIENVETGFGLNIAYGDGEFGEGRGDFGMLSGLISLFAGFEIEETVPVTVILAQGFYDFDDITRSIDLGSHKRSSRGSTTGTTTGISAKARYNFQENEEYTFGGSLGLSYEKISVNSYSESGSQSTSMTFGSQDVDKATGSIGLFYNFLQEYDWARVRYQFRGEYLYFVSDSSRSISAKVSNFDNEFEMPAYTADGEGLIQLTLGADFTLPSGLTGACAYQLMYGDVAMINALRVGLNF
jgi:outer membrane lipase/esterase